MQLIVPPEDDVRLRVGFKISRVGLDPAGPGFVHDLNVDVGIFLLEGLNGRLHEGGDLILIAGAQNGDGGLFTGGVTHRLFLRLGFSCGGCSRLLCRLAVSAGYQQRTQHDQRQKQTNRFFHFFVPPVLFYGSGFYFHGPGRNSMHCWGSCSAPGKGCGGRAWMKGT